MAAPGKVFLFSGGFVIVVYNRDWTVVFKKPEMIIGTQKLDFRQPTVTVRLRNLLRVALIENLLKKVALSVTVHGRLNTGLFDCTVADSWSHAVTCPRRPQACGLTASSVETSCEPNVPNPWFSLTQV